MTDSEEIMARVQVFDCFNHRLM